MPITFSRTRLGRRNNGQTKRTRWWHCFVPRTDTSSHRFNSEPDNASPSSSPPSFNFVPPRPPLLSRRRFFPSRSGRLPPTPQPVPQDFTSEYAEQLDDDMRFRSPPEVNNNAISTVKITEAYKRIELHCSICREEYRVGEEAAQLPCNHRYHSACVASWLNLHKTCPVCRRQVENTARDESGIHGFDPEEDVVSPRSVVITIE